MSVVESSLRSLNPADAEGFRQLLFDVSTDRRGWSGKSGRILLAAATDRLAGLAASCGAETSDAVAAAWELWANGEVDGADDPWSWTAAAVRRKLNREDHAQRLLTSADGLRRHGSAARPTLVGGEDLLESASANTAEDELRSEGSIVVRQILIMHGVAPALSSDVTRAIITAAARSCSSSAAVDRISRDHNMAAQFGFTSQRWRALVTIALGTTRGHPGVLEMTHRGHPYPTQVEYIRRALRRLQSPEKVAA